MIPKRESVVLLETVEEKKMPSLTYAMMETKGEIRGNADGLEAIKQAIYKILMTERYRYLIYDFQYGVELADLYGRPAAYVIPEVEKRIREALLADDRVNSVEDFQFSEEQGALAVRFQAETELGTIELERKVETAYV
ncbi:DUF2634 domain-containing protein [Anaerotignum lactatifermentans]|uniref:DUF2634 domain-containing protein n=1 Tax=Anaerotignum lactatifermentans TaxID=160404 RepID=A0ABS2G895_9FIRM|nr:DUF2634 domain-containing protein [Anaerotignum lactatifermentans]MBM6828770.1 DUF2634 domain-containing protein [Anaerotignum lactatifermentans]MBM6877097.1 DUF2634 domain-containing protein [Anaerotignum lactatifermentans]MBM6950352.1 DUF2634 domain-containing protein [Anaerotignum lactatifermentans]